MVPIMNELISRGPVSAAIDVFTDLFAYAGRMRTSMMKQNEGLSVGATSVHDVLVASVCIFSRSTRHHMTRKNKASKERLARSSNH